MPTAEEVACVEFNPTDVEAITEDIRRLHSLAVTLSGHLDLDKVHQFVQANPRPSLELTPEPLDHSFQFQTDEIRLLEVLSGIPGSLIKCALFNASSVQHEEHFALLLRLRPLSYE